MSYELTNISVKSLPGVGLKKAFDAVRRGGETFDMVSIIFRFDDITYKSQRFFSTLLTIMRTK